MPLPVIICDDSSFARKQMARALPKGWDVDVTFCANGLEAVEALRAGKGDILFLDLTMPLLDGFGVLEVIRKYDLQTLPIVVSGDIQAESRQRVMQLGAVAFIKKPIDANELTTVLDEYGVLGVLAENGYAIDIQVEFTDWCQEIANVAMGRAAELLTRVSHEVVELSVPQVSLRDSEQLLQELSADESQARFDSVWQGFIGYGLSGEIMLQFENHARSEGETLMDIANVLIGAFLSALAEQLDIAFCQGQPQLLRAGTALCLREAGTRQRQQILAVEFNYQLGKEQQRCKQLTLFTEDSLPVMKMRAEYAMEGG